VRQTQMIGGTTLFGGWLQWPYEATHSRGRNNGGESSVCDHSGLLQFLCVVFWSFDGCDCVLQCIWAYYQKMCWKGLPQSNADADA
jgi:hypothetical protein